MSIWGGAPLRGIAPPNPPQEGGLTPAKARYAFYNKWRSRDITRKYIDCIASTNSILPVQARAAAIARGLAKAKSTKKWALPFIDLFNEFNLY